MLPQAQTTWQQILRTNFTSIDALAEYLELNQKQQEQLILRKGFPLNLPLRLASKIEKRNVEDPLFKQFVPIAQESVFAENFLMDPLEESHCRPNQKLLHKYQGRVLLICTSACAMHCRYCFRQNFPYSTEKKDFVEELAYIASDDSLHEVILSGGDPLSLNDERLGSLLRDIDKIPHIKRIRFHTRFPVGIPERIDEGLCAILKDISKQIWVVIHANHPNELDDGVFHHLSKLQRLGIPVLNQSVLLKGINDSADVLAMLFEKLADHAVLPYYLHQLDRVQGASHFEVPIEKGKELMRELERRLSGYALPKYVQEVPDLPAKQRIHY